MCMSRNQEEPAPRACWAPSTNTTFLLRPAIAGLPPSLLESTADMTADMTADKKGGTTNRETDMCASPFVVPTLVGATKEL